MTTFNRNIPQPTDLISNSQPILLSNNQVLDSGTTQTGTGFTRNHVTMTDGTNGGLHNRIDFYQNIAVPSISGFVASLYPANISSASELKYTNAGGSTQITSGSLPIWKGGTVASGVVTATIASSGKMVLPNGLTFIWGPTGNVSTGGTSITFPAGGFAANCFSLTLTAATSNARAASYTNLSRTGFTAWSENNGTNMTYIAIGN